jgi:hypothetical protein
MANQNQHIEATRTQLNAFHLARPRPGLAQRNIPSPQERAAAAGAAPPTAQELRERWPPAWQSVLALFNSAFDAYRALNTPTGAAAPTPFSVPLADVRSTAAFPRFPPLAVIYNPLLSLSAKANRLRDLDTAAQREAAARARRSDANSSANRAIRQKRRHGVKSRASKQYGDCKRSPHVRRSRSRSPPPGPGAGLASLASAPRGKDGRVVPGVVNYGK